MDIEPYQKVYGNPLESIKTFQSIGKVMGAYKVKPIKCLKVVKTLIQPQTPGQAF